MLKELQKKMEEEKLKMLNPLKEEIKGTFDGFDFNLNYDHESSTIVGVFSRIDEKTKQIVSISFLISKDTEQITTFGSEVSFIGHDVISGVKSIPITFNFNDVKSVVDKIRDFLSKIE